MKPKRVVKVSKHCLSIGIETREETSESQRTLHKGYARRACLASTISKQGSTLSCEKGSLENKNAYRVTGAKIITWLVYIANYPKGQVARIWLMHAMRSLDTYSILAIICFPKGEQNTCDKNGSCDETTSDRSWRLDKEVTVTHDIMILGNSHHWTEPPCNRRCRHSVAVVVLVRSSSEVDCQSRAILCNPSHLRLEAITDRLLSVTVRHSRCKISRRPRRSSSSPNRFSRRSYPNPDTRAASAAAIHDCAIRRDRQFGIDIDMIQVVRRDRSQPDCLSVSSGYITNQIVLGVPLGSPKTSMFLQDHMLHAGAKASRRATRSDRGEPYGSFTSTLCRSSDFNGFGLYKSPNVLRYWI
uniref:Uncharacterized protein n=1 Tax=Cucumis melo TaxID=3656 RepID=A0A9I9E538_CUCME